MSQLSKGETAQKFDTKNKLRGIRRLKDAVKNSARAVDWLCRNETAFRQEIFLLIGTVVVISWWEISVYEKAALLGSVLFIIFAEIVNTAVEATIDRIGYELHDLAGLAKDLGSAAVTVAILISFIIWGAVVYHNSS